MLLFATLSQQCTGVVYIPLFFNWKKKQDFYQELSKPSSSLYAHRPTVTTHTTESLSPNPPPTNPLITCPPTMPKDDEKTTSEGNADEKPMMGSKPSKTQLSDFVKRRNLLGPEMAKSLSGETGMSVLMMVPGRIVETELGTKGDESVDAADTTNTERGGN